MLVQQALPDTSIKSRISDLAVGLAINCDKPPQDVRKIFTKHLPNARELPLVALLTQEGDWVSGYSGWKDTEPFSDWLAAVEQRSLLEARPDARKQLKKHAAAAIAAVDKKDWQTVLKATQAAHGIFGRCPEREELEFAEAETRWWAKDTFAEILEAGRSGADLKSARQKLTAMQKPFAGQPGAVAAAKGLDAIKLLIRVRNTEKRGSTANTLRSKASEQLDGSLWVDWFE